MNVPNYNLVIQKMNAKKMYEKLINNEEIEESEFIAMQNSILKLVGVDSLPFLMNRRQFQGLMSFICEKNDVLAVLPTGMGKTMLIIICGLYMKRIFNKRTIVIGLLKALTAEQKETFSKYAKTIIADGDHRNVDFNSNWTFACLTPEKFDSLVCNSNKRDQLLHNVGLLATDEAHTISSPSRGHRMENYMIVVRKTYPDIRTLYLSATIGNPEEFAEWTQTDLVLAGPEERPVPLELNIEGYKEIMYPWSLNKKKPIPDVRKNFEKRMIMLKNIMRNNPDKNWLIFTTSRKRTEQVAYALANLKTPCGLENLVDRFDIAYHNAGLTKSQRKFVEEGFKLGEIKVICSTPTLAVGVNLPADCTVLFDVHQFDMLHGRTVIGANRIQQTMGRAGRLGFSEYGYAYIFTPNKIKSAIRKMAMNPLVVNSTIKPRLHEKILQWVNADICYTIEQIVEVGLESYADISEEEIRNAINYLIVFGFLTASDVEDEFIITELGYKTCQMYMTPETIVSWKDQIDSIIDVDDFNELFVRFTSVKEYMSNLTVRQEDEVVCDYSKRELGSYFPDMEPEPFKCMRCSKNNSCSMLKEGTEKCEDHEDSTYYDTDPRVLKAFFLTFYGDLAERYLPKKWNDYTKKMETKHLPISAGDKFLLKDTGKRIFTSASVIFSSNQKLARNLKILSKMVEAGTQNKDLIDIMGLKGIGVAYAKKLVDSGIKTQGSFLESSKFKIAKILGISAKKAESLIEKNLQF